MTKPFMVLFLVLALLVACHKKTETEVEQSVPVNVLVVKPDSIRSLLEVTGNLEADKEALVVSKISEELKTIVRPVGSKVKAGEVIAILNDALLLQAKRQAQAALESAKVRLKNVQQDFERYQRLYTQKAISQQQWQQIQAKLREAEAAVQQMQANFAQAKEQFENSRIKAPFSGLVGSFFFDVGQMVPAGQPVARIVNPALMKAKLYVPDIYLSRIKTDLRVVATFPALPNQVFEGKIVKVDRAIDPLSRTLTVEVMFDNTSGKLTSGLYGLFNIELEQHRHVVVVPDNSILSQTIVQVDPQTGKPHARRQLFVFVVKQGHAVRKDIQSGLMAQDRTEIVQGLTFGDSLIIVGQRMVKDGQAVKVVEVF